MSINLNEKIREQDLKNLSLIKYSRVRCIRTLKVFLLFPLPIGALLYTVWEAIIRGLPRTGAHTDLLLMDLMMELGNLIYILAAYLILGTLYAGVPVLIVAGWLSYRTYKIGDISYPEAAFVTAVTLIVLWSAVNIVYHWSFPEAYSYTLSQWALLLPVLLIAVLSNLVCSYIVRELNAADVGK